MSPHEELAVERGARSGATIAVAIHSTLLGPALGGARMWHYECDGDAIADAMRLAEEMTHKAAAAGLALGGGKGVIATPTAERPAGALRTAMLLDFGDLVESLEGRYVTAEDVGTGADDMAVIARRTHHVLGLDTRRGGSGDPSPLTALGVRGAMRACCNHRWGTPELAGRRIVVIGFGHVGAELAGLLRDDGAELVVTDVDRSYRAAAEALGASWVEAETALSLECDVLAPCALGGAVDRDSVERLRCAVLCGAANNVLADEGLARRLQERGILYAPDFIANAGGLISVYGELTGTPPEAALRMSRQIEQTTASILVEAERGRTHLLAAARKRSRRRLGGGGAAAAVPDGEPVGARLRDF